MFVFPTGRGYSVYLRGTMCGLSVDVPVLFGTSGFSYFQGYIYTVEYMQDHVFSIHCWYHVVSECLSTDS